MCVRGDVLSVCGLACVVCLIVCVVFVGLTVVGGVYLETLVFLCFCVV